MGDIISWYDVGDARSKHVQQYYLINLQYNEIFAILYCIFVVQSNWIRAMAQHAHCHLAMQ